MQIAVVADEKLHKRLFDIEEKQRVESYKIGVLYAKPGQTDEDAMFSNKHAGSSRDYREFLEFLGEKIPLEVCLMRRGEGRGCCQEEKKARCDRTCHCLLCAGVFW